VLKYINQVDKLVFSPIASQQAPEREGSLMKIDVHQHLWTEPLVQALQERAELPFVRREHGLTVLFMNGERPYVIERSSETRARRAAVVHGDGLDRALVCLSSP
jgi:hypothetical protein